MSDSNLTVDLTTHIHCHRHVGATWKHVSFPKNNGSCLVSTHYKETFDPEVLFILFLPPIIFHGAYTLNQRRFIGNLGSVLTFAFLGTVITCVVIGSCVYGFTRLMVLAGHAKDGDFPLTVCFLFGAIMSATDPVSVLSLFSELRVDPDVYTLLFGESVLNDAVAIALTRAITSYSPPPKDIGSHGIISDEIHAYFSSVGHFVGVFVGSFLLGFTFTLSVHLTKFTRLRESPLLETSLLFLLSWSSFLSAEACNMSGIMAVLFCGLSQARYTVHNLSPEAKTRTKQHGPLSLSLSFFFNLQLFEFFTFLGEIFIFGYMGYVWFTFPHHVFNVLFIVGAFLAVFISRACNVYPLCFLLNLGRTNKIPRNVQHLMMFAGLRGAVAFALAVGLHRGESADARRADAKRTIFTTALLLVCSTVWLLGAAAGPALSLLGIRLKVAGDPWGDLTPSRSEQSGVPPGPSCGTAGL
ncbi:sodium/hydrogen exchanger 9-like [Polymixia lowei]